nr:hypothetical protein [uncultured Desulfobulbus sp.]
MKMMRMVCLIGVCFLSSQGQPQLLLANEPVSGGSIQEQQQRESQAPSKWEVAGNEVKEASSAVVDATRDSASSTWKGIKEGSSEAWNKTKTGSKELYDTVGEKSKEAWKATKEESQELWQKGKAAVHDATSPNEAEKPALGEIQKPEKPRTLETPEHPQVKEPETYKL